MATKDVTTNKKRVNKKGELSFNLLGIKKEASPLIWLGV